MTGPEALLRSLGLGEVIEAAKQFASAGTMEKIVNFADEVGAINSRLRRIEMILEQQYGSTVEPGSDASNGGPQYLTFGHEQQSLEEYRSDR